MKQSILLISALLLISTFVKAQSGDKIAISLGPELGVPFNAGSDYYGKITDYYKVGYGGSIKIEVPVASSLHLTGSVGYTYYGSNFKLLVVNYNYTPASVATYQIQSSETSNNSLPYKYLPLKAGLQYYYTRHLYIGGEAGEAIKLNSASGNSFIYSGGLGGVVPVTKHNGIDISARYERGYRIVGYPYAMNQFAFRLAYRFGW